MCTQQVKTSWAAEPAVGISVLWGFLLAVSSHPPHFSGPQTPGIPDGGGWIGEVYATSKIAGRLSKVQSSVQTFQALHWALASAHRPPSAVRNAPGSKTCLPLAGSPVTGQPPVPR